MRRSVRFPSHAGIQTAIAAMRAQTPDSVVTNWIQIAVLYEMLMRAGQSSVVELNRVVAVTMRDGSQAGLTPIDVLLLCGDLTSYHFAHAARVDLCRRLGQAAEARASYERALSLTQQEPERRFLAKRLREAEE